MNPIDDDYAFGARLREERERLGLQLHELSLKPDGPTCNRSAWRRARRRFPSTTCKRWSGSQMAT